MVEAIKQDPDSPFYPHIIKTIRKMAEDILDAKEKYYAGCPGMSDRDYDVLEHNLRHLAPNHPVLEFVGTPEGIPKEEREELLNYG